jgi:hypothetical protein
MMICDYTVFIEDFEMSAQFALQDDSVQTDDDIIARNQSLRRRFVGKLTSEGTTFPDDPKAGYLLLTAMADMDRTAIQNKKIGATERQGAADRQAAMLIATLGGHYGARSPFEVDSPDSPRIAAPVLDPSRMLALELVPGETDTAPVAENHDQFMERMDQKTGFVQGHK